MRTVVVSPLVLAMSLCASLSAAEAGTSGAGPSQSVAQNAQAPSNMPDQNNAIPPATQQPGSGSSTAPGSLSHELSRSGGVIHPAPSPDRGVIAPPNQGISRTPVIRPPGTPGGNPMVQPK